VRSFTVWSLAVIGTLGAVGCGGQSEAPAPAAAPPKPPLEALAESLAARRVVVVDLTQPLGPSTPIIQLPKPFANSPAFKAHLVSNFDAKGPAWYWNWMEVGEHHGTHFDAPCHWVSGKDRPCVDQLEADQFIGPAAVVDVTAEVAKNPEFIATRQTLLDWEQKHGRIPARAWVILHTGWASRAADPKQFFNIGADGAPHFPGWGKETAEFLTKERDVLGVGVEQVGTDGSTAGQSDPPYPNHFIMHGAGKYGLTQLTNVDKLPPTGALIIATPLKIQRGSGSPVRVIALVPAS
jgi:isatin hydrolase